MNAAGLTFVLYGASGVLSMPFYQGLVTDGTISQGELDGTRKRLSLIVETLRKTPTEKIEAMVAQYNEELTDHLNKFNDRPYECTLNAFQNAQIMTGYVSTILAKAGISE